MSGLWFGRRVILTGATSGIGWELARILVRRGAIVIATGRRSERLDTLKSTVQNPQQLMAIAGDICDPIHRQRLMDAAVNQLGGLDVLINNAGIGAIGPFRQATPDRLRRIFEVDFFAAVELTRLAIEPLTHAKSPAICLVNSVLGYRGVPDKSEYCAAKFALRGWAESLRVELMPLGIDVISVYPSTTRSEFLDSLIETLPGTASRSMGSQSASQVASCIIGALQARRLSAFPSLTARAMVWLSQAFPGLTDRLLLRSYRA
ncbi:MAG: SDR family NAD(P)-dependent oxidoreductase [Pirellulaceae bacterium]|nr:SDR family NAD(P)-dependent oxidoreductase [Pirellulaceae bacterium]